MTQPM